MDQPTLKPVRATGREQGLYRRFALIGLVSAAVVLIGFARAAPSVDDRVPAVDESRPSASPTPTSVPSEAGWDQTFMSDRFGYSIRYPNGWTTRAATSADLSDWIKAPLPSTTALSIRRVSRPAGAGLPAFAETNLPHRADQGCPQDPDGREGLHEFVVGGRGGAYRSECGYVDALVMDGPGFLSITLWPGPTRSGSQWWFERFVEHLKFSEANATPAATPDEFGWERRFTSDRYGFSIRYPEGWIPIAAPDPSKPDRILAPPPSATVLSIRRFTMPERQEFFAFADGHLRHRAEPDGCHWSRAGIIFIPAERDALHLSTIDGHSAAYRSECSHVDAVVDLGDEFLGITLASGTRKATGDTWWFERFVAHLQFADDGGSAAAHQSTLFISVMHGYTVRDPTDWHVSHARRNSDPDVLYDGRVAAPESEFTSRMSIRRRALPAGIAIADVTKDGSLSAP
jgi:hypothetical protein